nr:MAG TPA: hypothetical protein [Caudoviricetes sp.]
MSIINFGFLFKYASVFPCILADFRTLLLQDRF